jgi:hypothetical protein
MAANCCRNLFCPLSLSNEYRTQVALSTTRADAGVGQGSPLLRGTGPSEFPPLRQGSSSRGNKRLRLPQSVGNGPPVSRRWFGYIHRSLSIDHYPSITVHRSLPIITIERKLGPYPMVNRRRAPFAPHRKFQMRGTFGRNRQWH